MRASDGKPRSAAGLAVTRCDSMPSLARFRDSFTDSAWYVLADPGGPYRINSTGEVVVEHRRYRTGHVILPVTAATGGTVAAVQAVDALSGVAFFAGGAMGGLVVGGLFAGTVALIRRSRRQLEERSEHRWRSQVVQTAGSQAWRLCELALRIAGVGAWADGTVDPARRVPSILWTAVKRARLTELQHSDAVRALDHESLSELARERLERIARERASLDAIESNLHKVLETAQKIDEQRQRSAEEQQRKALRRQEEAELRRRLTGVSALVSDPARAEDEVDRSAGVVAEAEEIARLLVESDLMLKELD